jgi:hypothetical protein
MFEDRNKNDLTKDITAAVWDWLDLRGFKPVETAVSAGNLGHPRINRGKSGAMRSHSRRWNRSNGSNARCYLRDC